VEVAKALGRGTEGLDGLSEALLGAADGDGNGEVDKEEFRRLLNGDTRPPPPGRKPSSKQPSVPMASEIGRPERVTMEQTGEDGAKMLAEESGIIISARAKGKKGKKQGVVAVLRKGLSNLSKSSGNHYSSEGSTGKKQGVVSVLRKGLSSLSKSSGNHYSSEGSRTSKSSKSSLASIAGLVGNKLGRLRKALTSSFKMSFGEDRDEKKMPKKEKKERKAKKESKLKKRVARLTKMVSGTLGEGEQAKTKKAASGEESGSDTKPVVADQSVGSANTTVAHEHSRGGDYRVRNGNVVTKYISAAWDTRTKGNKKKRKSSKEATIRPPMPTAGSCASLDMEETLKVMGAPSNVPGLRKHQLAGDI